MDFFCMESKYEHDSDEKVFLLSKWKTHTMSPTRFHAFVHILYHPTEVPIFSTIQNENHSLLRLYTYVLVTKYLPYKSIHIYI